MQFIGIRELRSKTAKVWKELSKEKELVVTSNGHPIAFICSIHEETLEETLAAIRQARAAQAVFSMQTESMQQRKDKITLEEINQEISSVRKKRKK